MQFIILLVIIGIIYMLFIRYNNCIKENLTREESRLNVRNMLVNEAKIIQSNKTSKIKDIKKEFFNWITKPENTFIYRNINIHTNKIKITKNKPNSTLLIGNIQIYYINSTDNNEYLLDSKHMNIIYSSVQGDDTNFYFKGLPTIKTNSTPDKLLDDNFKINPTDNYLDWYDTVSVKCEPDQKLIGCQCYGETCTGSEIVKDRDESYKCVAYNKKNGSEITAQAICATSNSSIKYDTRESETTEIDNIECGKDHPHMISCNCKPDTTKPIDNDICEGSNIEKDINNNTICKIYKNKYITNKDAKPIATCANMSNINIRHSLDEDLDKLTLEPSLKINDKKKHWTAKCNVDEHIIGCRCVPKDKMYNNGCKGVEIDPFSNKCQSHNLLNYESYPDITCLKFKNKKKCLENQNLESEKTCETEKSGNEKQFIIIKLNKFYNLSKIVVHNYCNIKYTKYNGMSNSTVSITDNHEKNVTNTPTLTPTLTTTPTTISFLPLKIELMNNYTILVTAIKDEKFNITLMNNYPSIPENNELYNNFYNNLENKGYNDNYSSFKQWSKNIHSSNSYSYCSINKGEDQKKKHLSCIHPDNTIKNINSDYTGEVDLMDLGIDPTMNDMNDMNDMNNCKNCLTDNDFTNTTCKDNCYQNYTQYFKNENKSDNKMSFCRCPTSTQRDSGTPMKLGIDKFKPGKKYDQYNHILCTPMSNDNTKFDSSKNYKVFKNLKKPCYQYTGEELKNYDEPELYTDCTYDLENMVNDKIDAGFYYNKSFYFFKNIRIDNNRFVLWCNGNFKKIDESFKFVIENQPTIFKLKQIIEVYNTFILKDNDDDYLYIIGNQKLENVIEKTLFKFLIKQPIKSGTEEMINNIKISTSSLTTDKKKFQIISNIKYFSYHNKIVKLNTNTNSISNMGKGMIDLQEINNRRNMNEIDFIIYNNDDNELYIFGMKDNVNESSKYAVLVRQQSYGLTNNDKYITFENIIWNIN